VRHKYSTCPQTKIKELVLFGILFCVFVAVASLTHGRRYSAQLKADPVIFSHLDALYDGLLEQNLIRLLEPFSSVQVSHIAELIHMDKSLVERKCCPRCCRHCEWSDLCCRLSQMILDKKFSGILDQGSDCLISFEAEPKNVRDCCYACSASL